MNESNSWRLGGHEAPPAIISVFLGTYLSNTLNEIARKVTDKKMTPAQKTELKLGIGKIPECCSTIQTVTVLLLLPSQETGLSSGLLVHPQTAALQ